MGKITIYVYIIFIFFEVMENYYFQIAMSKIKKGKKSQRLKKKKNYKTTVLITQAVILAIDEPFPEW